MCKLGDGAENLYRTFRGQGTRTNQQQGNSNCSEVSHCWRRCFVQYALSKLLSSAQVCAHSQTQPAMCWSLLWTEIECLLWLQDLQHASGSMQHVIIGGPDNMTHKQKGSPRTRSFASVSSMACRTSANALLLTGVTALAISNRPCTRSPDAPCLASPSKNPCRYFSAKSSSSPAPPLSRLCA